MLEKCPLSFNPYTYCPIMFRHEDETILAMVTMLVADIKRIHFQTLPMNDEDARMIDRATREITAYMNGRIHELVKMLPKAVSEIADGPGQPGGMSGFEIGICAFLTFLILYGIMR